MSVADGREPAEGRGGEGDKRVRGGWMEGQEEDKGDLAWVGNVVLKIGAGYKWKGEGWVG